MHCTKLTNSCNRTIILDFLQIHGEEALIINFECIDLSMPKLIEGLFWCQDSWISLKTDFRIAVGTSDIYYTLNNVVRVKNTN